MSRKRVKLSAELKNFLKNSSNREVSDLQKEPLFKSIITKLREYENFLDNVVINDNIEELLQAYSAIEQKLISSTIRYADITSDDIVIQCYDELKLIYDFIQSKATWVVTDIHVDEFVCPKCGAEIVAEKSDRRSHKFCHYCGTRLAFADFLEEDEEKLKNFGYID